MRAYKPNPDFDKDAKDVMRPALEQAARAIEARAEQLTPKRTGRMRRSVSTVSTHDGVFVAGQEPFFHLTEWGSVNNPPYAPLRLAVRSVGLRLDEQSGP